MPVMIVALAVAAAACPYPTTAWTAVAAKRDLPAAVVATFSDLAEKGAPFQATDLLPSGEHPPFARFVAAQACGCDLTVDYEQGGIAHSWLTATFRFANGRWTRLGAHRTAL